jgi:hypothetical protein
VMGGVQSIWLMRGDPASGGRIDAISRSIGIIGPDAWCLDPQGNMYFFGGGVFYRMGPVGQSTMYSKTLGNMPEGLSKGRLDKTFGAVDASNSQVLLLWDETLHGVHIYITPLNPGPATHYWWDERTDSFWREQYPDVCGPSSIFVLTSPNSAARVDLLGGQDGAVRQIDATSKTDDGTTILSRVKFAPLSPGATDQDAMLSRVTTVLDSASDPVSVRVYAAQSPEEVVAATTPAWSYMASPTFRYSTPRVRGNSLLVEVKNDSFSLPWVMGHGYNIGDQVVASDGNPYVSLTIHTSTTGGSHPTPPGNTTDWVLSSFRSWALETIATHLDIVGRTRHGRI